jgi:hypothetical protein
VNQKVEAFDENVIRSKRASIKHERNYTRRDLPFAGPNFQGYAEAKGRDTFKANASVQYRQAFELGIAEVLGLTPRFIPGLIYELTRYSWVLDWWFEVGPWLAALRQKPGITILGNTVGMKVVRDVTYKADGETGVSPNKVRRPIGVLGEYNKTSYSRSINQHLPLTPQLSLDFQSYYHLIDSLALSLQAALRGTKRR